MITNNSLTIYHLENDDNYTRYNYEKVWIFNTMNTNLSKGLDDRNSIVIRIPYELNEDLDISNFSKDDIIVCGNLDIDINSQNDLKGYDIFNIKSINNNNFGTRPHITLRGI